MGCGEAAGRGCSRTNTILEYAKHSVGRMDGIETVKKVVQCLVEEILRLDEKLEETGRTFHAKRQEISYAENILGVSEIGENIISEMGDRSGFENVG